MKNWIKRKIYLIFKNQILEYVNNLPEMVEEKFQVEQIKTSFIIKNDLSPGLYAHSLMRAKQDLIEEIFKNENLFKIEEVLEEFRMGSVYKLFEITLLIVKSKRDGK